MAGNDDNELFLPVKRFLGVPDNTKPAEKTDGSGSVSEFVQGGFIPNDLAGVLVGKVVTKALACPVAPKMHK